MNRSDSVSSTAATVVLSQDQDQKSYFTDSQLTFWQSKGLKFTDSGHVDPSDDKNDEVLAQLAGKAFKKYTRSTGGAAGGLAGGSALAARRRKHRGQAIE